MNTEAKKKIPRTADEVLVAEGLMSIEETITPPVLNLWQKINKVRAEIGGVEHDKQIGEGGGYWVTTHQAILRRLRPLMAKYGLVDWIELQELKSIDTGLTQGKHSRKVLQYQGGFVYSVVNVDSPDEVHAFPVVAYADDGGDKGPGKVYTYALKSGQKILFQIGTGDDDEEGRIEDVQAAREPTLTPEQFSEVLEVSDEYFGDDQKAILTDLCSLLSVKSANDIPQRMFKWSLNVLKKRAITEGRIEGPKPAADDV